MAGTSVAWVYVLVLCLLAPCFSRNIAKRAVDSSTEQLPDQDGPTETEVVPETDSLPVDEVVSTDAVVPGADDAVPASEPDAVPDATDPSDVAATDAQPDGIPPADISAVAEAAPQTDSDPGTDTEVPPEPQPEQEPETEPSSESVPVAEPEPSSEAQPDPEPASESQPEPEPSSEAQPESEPSTEPVPEPEQSSEAQPEPEPSSEPGPEPDSSVLPQVETDPASEPGPEPESEPGTEPASPESQEGSIPIGGTVDSSVAGTELVDTASPATVPSMDADAFPFQGGFVFDSPFFSFSQIEDYFKKLEKAMEKIFKDTMDEVGTDPEVYKNTTERVVDVDGTKYRVHTTVIKGGDENNAVSIEAVSAIPENMRRKRSLF